MSCAKSRGICGREGEGMGVCRSRAHRTLVSEGATGRVNKTT